jgi:hypothetical protein
VVVGAAISRYVSLLDGLERRVLDDQVFRSIIERDLMDGQHRNPAARDRPEFFTTAYFHLPDELAQEATVAGLCDVRLFAVEGPAWMVEDPDDLDNQMLAARAWSPNPR